MVEVAGSDEGAIDWSRASLAHSSALPRVATSSKDGAPEVGANAVIAQPLVRRSPFNIIHLLIVAIHRRRPPRPLDVYCCENLLLIYDTPAFC